MITQVKFCNCGSGQNRYMLKDASGIFCAYVCSRCEPQVRKKYDPKIFNAGSRYASSGREEDLW